MIQNIEGLRIWEDLDLSHQLYTKDLISRLLSQLTCSNDESLQCLSFRLDFNQHYKKRDARLSKPLTFSHRYSTFQMPSSFEKRVFRRMSMSGHGSPMTGSQMTSSAMSIGP